MSEKLAINRVSVGKKISRTLTLFNPKLYCTFCASLSSINNISNCKQCIFCCYRAPSPCHPVTDSSTVWEIFPFSYSSDSLLFTSLNARTKICIIVFAPNQITYYYIFFFAERGTKDLMQSIAKKGSEISLSGKPLC